MLADEHLGIAVVDDDPVMLDLVASIISAASKFEVFKTADGDALIALLGRQHIDCIILDYNLDKENGFAVLQRANELYPRIPPVVMLTGVGTEATVVKAMRLGIDDYVIKRTMNPGELLAAISRTIENDRKETAAKAEFERLKAAAALDLVTGVLGSAKLEEHLATLAALASDARDKHALILVELVQLKEIREQLGLKAGDQALREFAMRLQRSIRSNDICGRLSDNTFLVVANVAGDQAALTNLCERIIAEVAMRLDLAFGSASVSGRIGAAICSSAAREGEIRPDELIEPARKALKTASEAGVSLVLPVPPAPPVEEGVSGAAAEPRSRPSAEPLRTLDRRRAWRQRVFKRGQILVPGLNTSINCMVRNLSTTGAGLRIENVFAVPDAFELAIFGSPERRKVRVRWQTGVDLGVEFMDIS